MTEEFPEYTPSELSLQIKSRLDLALQGVDTAPSEGAALAIIQTFLWSLLVNLHTENKIEKPNNNNDLVKVFRDRENPLLFVFLYEWEDLDGIKHTDMYNTTLKLLPDGSCKLNN